MSRLTFFSTSLLETCKSVRQHVCEDFAAEEPEAGFGIQCMLTDLSSVGLRT